MRRIHTAPMELFAPKANGTFELEPHEAGWASEAIAMLYVHFVEGPSPVLRVKAQISVDGVRWMDLNRAFRTDHGTGRLSPQPRKVWKLVAPHWEGRRGPGRRQPGHGNGYLLGAEGVRLHALTSAATLWNSPNRSRLRKKVVLGRTSHALASAATSLPVLGWPQQVRVRATRKAISYQ